MQGCQSIGSGKIKTPELRYVLLNKDMVSYEKEVGVPGRVDGRKGRHHQ